MTVIRWENKVDERPFRCMDCANKKGANHGNTGLFNHNVISTNYMCTMGHGLVFNIDYACNAIVIKEK